MSPLERLRVRLAELDSVVIAFSGGADSAFLAHVATEVLGRDQALAVTAISPSLAPEEEVDCAALAREWNLNWQAVHTNELADVRYSMNNGDRCFHCKSALMDAVAPIAAERGATVILGVNVDDLGDHRPGQKSAAERGAAFPMVDAGLTKSDIRALSAQLGLRTWDKPAAACLASRVPYGTPVSLTTLTAVAKAESALRRLGFRQLRVRHYDETARIEVALTELPLVLEHRQSIVDATKKAGYQYVTLDLEGLRSGNLNAALVGDRFNETAVGSTH